MMDSIKTYLKQVTTKQDLIRIGRNVPNLVDAIVEGACEDGWKEPDDRIMSADIPLWHRLCFLNDSGTHHAEHDAWNLFHIAMITFDVQRLAEWLNGVLDRFMTDERMAQLPPELRCRLYGARSYALLPLATHDPFHYSESALSNTVRALEYPFRDTDFHFWVQLEYNRCFYLTIQVRGSLRDHIDQCLTRSQALLITVQDATGVSDKMIRDVYNVIGVAYSRRQTGNQTGNIEQSLYYHQLALETALKNSPDECGPMYNNLGLMYRHRIAGDYAENIETSIRYLDQALAAHMRTGKRLRIAQTLTNLGVSYCERLFGNRLDNLHRAADCYRRALRYMDPELHAGFRAWTQHNLGVAYQFLPAGRKSINQERALHSYRRALDFRKKESTPMDWLVTTQNLSKLYSVRQRGNRRLNCETAIRLMDGALDIIPREASPIHWAKANVCLGIIWSRRLAGDRRANLEKSAGFFTAALKFLESATLPAETREAALWLGRVMLRLNRCAEAERALLTAAQADAYRYRQMFMNPSRMREIESGSEIYFLLAETLARQGKHAEALQWLEKGKSRVLTEQLRVDQAAFRQLPEQLQHRYLELTEKLHSLQFEHFVPEKDIAPVIDETRSTRDQLDRFIDTIRAEHAGFMREQEDAGDIDAGPADGECFIEYDITDLGTRIFIVTTRDGNTCVRSVFNGSFSRQDLHAFISPWITGIRRVRFDSSPENIARWSRFMLKHMKRLSAHLFEPVRKLIDASGAGHLVLVPHLSLHMLPLHLMPVSQSRSSDLLIDAYSISYLPSLTIGSLSRRGKKSAGAGQFVGISNPTLDLAWADRETDGIQRIFNKTPTRLLKGEDAQREAVESAMSAAAYIHFAGHARFDASDPYNSFLALAASAVRQPEPVQTRLISHTIYSDPLHLADIYRRLKLNHHPLVVLSCCESGLTTESVSNDEFIGFAAGFLSSGARAVMSSLWVVDDQATCELMELFYRNHIQHGMPAPDALRCAQLAIRSNPKYAHPFYWAAFKMNGS